MVYDVEAPTEEEKIVEWRFSTLAEAGYDVRKAQRLAARLDIDLHVAVDLIKQGCDQETAVKILV